MMPHAFHIRYRASVNSLMRMTPCFWFQQKVAVGAPSSEHERGRGIRMTWTALSITSAGRFSPLGPLGIIRSY